MGLQPPKPQLAAQSAFLEECEGLLMVTPSLTVLGARSHTALPHFFLFFVFFTHTHANMLTNKHVDPHKCVHTVLYVCRQKHIRTGRDRVAQSVSSGLWPLLFFEQ